MSENTKYKFDLNMVNPCNFTYRRFIGDYYTQTASYNEEQLMRYLQYIKNVLSSCKDNRKKMITIYGVDFLHCIDVLQDFILKSLDYVDFVFLSVSPKNFQKHAIKLYKLARLCNYKLKIDFECDPSSLLDIDESEYNSVLYNIRWVYGRGIGGYIKIPLSSIKTVPKLFNVYKRLSLVLPNVKFEFFLDYTNNIDVDIDVDTSKQLNDIKNILNNNTKMRENFVYRPPHSIRNGQLTDSLISNTMSVMADGGVIYPGYDISILTDVGIKELSIGNIEDNFEELFKKRSSLFTNINNYDHKDVSNLYRAVPFDYNIDNMPYNMVADENAITLHKLLLHYLSTSGV